jgi:hypothetical protein
MQAVRFVLDTTQGWRYQSAVPSGLRREIILALAMRRGDGVVPLFPDSIGCTQSSFSLLPMKSLGRPHSSNSLLQ